MTNSGRVLQEVEESPSGTDENNIVDFQPIHDQRRSFSVSLDSRRPPSNHTPAAGRRSLDQKERNGYIILDEDDCYEELGFCFPSWKKWMIITVIFLVQTSMNFNTSLYSNAIGGISEEFGVSLQAARCGAMIYLITYAFGCELWAPWSEELGRKPILQLSMFLTNIWQLPVALAPNFATIMVGRAFGGLSLAGGSVTLGMIADLWEPEHQHYAVACVVFSSVGGSVLGPLIGGFVEAFQPWPWAMWIQLIFGGFVQLCHLVLVPETRSTIMINNYAKKQRKETGLNVCGPDEFLSFKERFSVKQIIHHMFRPFRMLVTEPIVLTLSLLSGFSDALIFMFIQSFSLVYAQWNFSTVAIGLSFIPILVGYIIAWLSMYPVLHRNAMKRQKNPDDEHAQYESRLWWLLYTAPCLPIGLIGFAWTSLGPPLHWMGTMVFAAIVGIANYTIYMTTIDYMICAYGPYSASATGGNGFARDFLAGVLTVPATPFFSNIGAPTRNLEYASTILFCISCLLVLSVYIIYWKGPTMRKTSPFAQQLSDARKESASRRASLSYTGSRPVSRRPSMVPAGSAPASRRASRVKPSSKPGSRRPSVEREKENVGSKPASRRPSGEKERHAGSKPGSRRVSFEKPMSRPTSRG
ncbi:hypothetical protein ASPVEDRAFT_86867 [Aspergillus versicolor CBS 583.65]|uniref:Major facilitator superfamily (MFS) profile domain-containing protein n=1 Tax=Aspergillus versicolor CBS 583.65 TaxID=1036611 RepID=A0A1L9PVE3_ASPVE|nr:uncharacterized protein ASPVEDRAFT_86867 [Aspergillus versicolor CBS 583.65]OJJ05524.1 hypothetical protein ASPVEDRAFT_86867 [Aspergillus versicolor CBS 583.65]